MCVWQLHPYFWCCGMLGHRLLLRMMRRLSRLRRARRLQPKRQIRRRIANPRMWNPQRVRLRLRKLKKPRRRTRVLLSMQTGRRRPILLPKRNLLRSPWLIWFHTLIPTVTVLKNLTNVSNPIPIEMFLIPLTAVLPRCRQKDPNIKARQIHALWKESEERSLVLKDVSPAEIKRRRY